MAQPGVGTGVGSRAGSHGARYGSTQEGTNDDVHSQQGEAQCCRAAQSMAGVFMCLSWEVKAVVKATVDGFASPSQPQGEQT